MYKFKLAIRYLLKRRITLLAIAAVALSVFIVVVVMTVMNGLVGEFREKNHRFVGDCVISSDSLVGFSYYREFISELEKQDYIEAVSPVVKSYGLLTQPGADWNIGLEIMGLDVESFARATSFADTLYYNRDDPENAFKPSYNPDLPGCIVGIDMMPRSRSRKGEYYHSPNPVRYELIISCFPLNAKGGLAKAGSALDNTLKFHFSDDSHTGLVKVDGHVVFIPFETAQMMFGMDSEPERVNSLHIRFKPGQNLNKGCDKIRSLWNSFVKSKGDVLNANLFDTVRVESWIVNRRETIAPMEKEQTMLMFLFVMLGGITVFIIFVVFYIIISHKSKDIGILKSIGISSFDITQVFLVFALFVGLIGSVIGSAAGCLVLIYANNIEDWLFEKYGFQIWDRSVYAIGELPNEIEWQVLAVIIATAVAASLIGAVLPSIQAASRKPAEILQVNQL